MSFSREDEQKAIELYYFLAKASSVLASCTFLLCEWSYAALMKKVVVEATRLSLGGQATIFEQSSSPLYRAVFLDDLTFEQVLFGSMLTIVPLNVAFRVMSDHASLHLGSRRTALLRRRIMTAALYGAYSGETPTVQNETKLEIGPSQVEKASEHSFSVTVTGKQHAQSTKGQVSPITESGSSTKEQQNVEPQSEELAEQVNPRHQIVDVMLRQLPIIERFQVEVENTRLAESTTVVLCVFAVIIFSWSSALSALAVFGCNVAWMVVTERTLVEKTRVAWISKAQELNTWLLGVIRTTDVISLCNMASSEQASLHSLEQEGLESVTAYAKSLWKQGIGYHTFMSLVFPVVILVAWYRLPILAPNEVIENAFALFVCFVVINQVHKALIALNGTSERKKQYDIARTKIFQWLELHEDLPVVDSSKQSNGDSDNQRKCCGKLTEWYKAKVAATNGGLVAARPSAFLQPGTLTTVGDIVLSNCQLRYPGSQSAEPVIRDMSFRFEKGKRYGIVGESGVGKSTVCNMLAGLLQPSLGTIKFGDTKLCLETKPLVRNHLVFVSQDTLLFERSVRENVLYGVQKSVPDSFILQIMEELNLQSWLDELGYGLDSKLTGGGELQLSGGQRQRMQLARLACRITYSDHIEYVFLDECIAALDPRSRRQAIKFLERFLRDRTVLIITHHYDILELCHDILEFGKGGTLTLRDLEKLREEE